MLTPNGTPHKVRMNVSNHPGSPDDGCSQKAGSIHARSPIATHPIHAVTSLAFLKTFIRQPANSRTI